MRLRTLLLLSTIFTVLMLVVMWLHGCPLTTTYTPCGILDLEFAGTVKNAQSIYDTWGSNKVRVAFNNTLIDFIFLICYGSLLYSAALTIARKLQNGLRKAGKWLSRAAVLAAFFDVLENLLMLRLLSGHISKELVASTYMFALIKFILIGLVLLYIAMYPIVRRNKQPATTDVLPDEL